jgi:nucleoside-diphosphate-sugar epimerase
VGARSRRVLLTGAEGFTGRPLAARLRQDGHEVIAACQHLSGPAGDGQVVLDLRDRDAVMRLVAERRPTVVVHLAGISAPTHGDVGELYMSNVVGTANLLTSLVASAVEPDVVMVASSAAVYAPGQGRAPLTEDHPLAPKTHYGVSKQAVEAIAAMHAGHFRIVVTRPFNYTGPGQSTAFLVPKIVRHFIERRSEIQLGNLDLDRDYSDITRVIEAYSRLVAAPPEAGTLNICSGRALHLADIVSMMREISGQDMTVVNAPELFRAEPHFILGSPTRLEAAVGVLPSPDFRETLKRMYREG